MRQGAIWLSVTLFLGAILLFGWLLPRQWQAERLEKEIQVTKSVQGDLSKLLPELAQNAVVPAPDPKPNAAGWLSSQALAGLERRIVSNTPSSAGRGAILKLRSLKAGEVTNLLQQLTRVNLVVKRLSVADLAGRGVWDVELAVEVPQPVAAPESKPKESPTP
jgi:hypothetical protein